MTMIDSIIEQQDAEIESLRSRLALSETDRGSLFARLCETEARLAEADALLEEAQEARIPLALSNRIDAHLSRKGESHE